MFTLYAVYGSARALLETVEHDFQARTMAARWSRSVNVDVIVVQEGQDQACWTFRNGVEQPGKPPEPPKA